MGERPETGTQTRMILEAGTEADPREEVSYWLALRSLLSLLSYATQDHQPRGWHSGLGLAISINNQENTHRLASRPI